MLEKSEIAFPLLLLLFLLLLPLLGEKYLKLKLIHVCVKFTKHFSLLSAKEAEKEGKAS